MRIEERNQKLFITDFNEIEAYKIACKIEKDGIGFYKNLAAKYPKKDELKRGLEFLLEEEAKHLKFFENALFDLRQEKDDLEEDNDLLNSMDYGVFKPYQDSRELEKILRNPQQAVRLGIIIENNSILFYESCKNNISSKETQEEISLIIQQEYKHRQLLEDILSNF